MSLMPSGILSSLVGGSWTLDDSIPGSATNEYGGLTGS